MKCALYRCWSPEADLLYVGISPSPLLRIHDHATHKDWAQSIASVTLEWFDSRAEAAQAEQEAIETEVPAHNVHHNGTQKRPEKLPFFGRNNRASVELNRYLAGRMKGAFARQIGIGQPTLSGYLSGIRKPRLERMIAIEQATGGAVTIQMWGQQA